MLRTRSLAWTLCALLLVTGALTATPMRDAGALAVADGVCARWDLTYPNWQCRASAGGYGTFDLKQVGEDLTGDWWNQAIQKRGQFTSGHIDGVSFGLHSAEGTTMWGTVSPNGLQIG